MSYFKLPLENKMGIAGRLQVVPSGLAVSEYLKTIDMVSQEHAIGWKDLCDERYLGRPACLLRSLCDLF